MYKNYPQAFLISNAVIPFKLFQVKLINQGL